MNIFTLVYTVLGGLGLFFLGMKMMSAALQESAGDLIRKAIRTLTSNRFLAVGVGTLVTLIVQSSSVTTVMVVGFVNAGIMELTQAIGVILGANIGTTITGWIISIKIGKYGLLLVGLGIFPFMFGNSERVRNTGKVILGVGLIFFGLEIMSGAFKPVRTMPEFNHFLIYFSAKTYAAYAASIMMGCILTMVIQSSSAMLGITMAMATTGVIGFHTAAALVLGENIGTTITALLAAVGGNVNAKRAARAHAIFNLLGVVAIFSIFPFYVELIEWLVPGDANFMNKVGEYPNIAVHIATGHTIFNVLGTILFIPFLRYFALLVVKITPDRTAPEHHHLIMLGNVSDLLPATALVQSYQEVIKLSELLQKMFDRARHFLQDKKSSVADLSKIKSYEQISDNIQKEVLVFVCKLMEKKLSSHQTLQAQSHIRISGELESIADYLEHLTLLKAKMDVKDFLAGEVGDDFFDFFDKVSDFFQQIMQSLKDPDNHDTTFFDRKNDELKDLADAIQEKHVKRVSEGAYPVLTSITYSDMIVAQRKIRGHIHNISQNLQGTF